MAPINHMQNAVICINQLHNIQRKQSYSRVTASHMGQRVGTVD